MGLAGQKILRAAIDLIRLAAGNAAHRLGKKRNGADVHRRSAGYRLRNPDQLRRQPVTLIEAGKL